MGGRRVRIAATAVAALCSAVVPLQAHASTAALRIDVLSNRADLVSDGQALVAIDLGAAQPSDVTVTLNANDVTSDFAVRPNGKFEGIVDGLAIGPNTLTATLPDAHGASITITNHANGGPVFSGPQIQPWVCHAGAVDAKCNDAPTYSFFYVPAAAAAPSENVAGFNVGLGLQPYDPNNPPADGTVAMTTTDQGATVPYIIRQEDGWQDRDRYSVAVLFDPAATGVTAWNPPAAWNHKLVITHGASCGTAHTEAAPPSVQDDAALSKGFMVMSTALDNAGHNCNVITEAESLIMAKERILENYGDVRYTIGTGCSGGSLVQHQVANAYPGLYDGLLPQCSFADAWSTGIQVEDTALLRRYFEDPTQWGTGVVWDPLAIGAVEGHPNHVNSVLISSYSSLFNPTTACPGVTENQYNAQTNPGGVRCTGADYMINMFGPRESDGFAGRILDNVGVQYGVSALMNGAITPAQFVDLNTRVGGHDIDYNWTSAREAADQPALQNAYTTGAINEANNLKDVAIIDLRGTDPGAFHDVFRAFAVRSRLERSNGTHENQVIWEGPVPLLGQADYTTLGLYAMDSWLAAVEADTRNVAKSQKIIDDRPSDIHDQCTDGAGQVIPDERVCHTINPMFTTPRIEAGEPFTDDVWKCQLRPMQRHDYFPMEFTDAEWNALQTALPDGVCNYAVPGVGQQPTVGWQTFQSDAAGDSVIYGGTPLGAPPVSTTF